MKSLRTIGALIAVTALAVFFRVYQLDTVPPGLYIDEAQNGIDANAIHLSRGLPVYIESPVKARGREPMYHILLSLAFRVLGPTTTGIRATSALIGIATVIACFFLVERLFGLPIAFYTGVLLAVARWHVTFSRLGMRAVLVPLWFALALLALLALARKRAAMQALVFGTVVGLGLYTYPAYWVLPVPLAALLALRLWRRAPDAPGRLLKLGAIALAAFLVITAPLARYVVSHSDTYFARVGALQERAARESRRGFSLRDNAQKVLFMLHLRGDPQARHNIPDKPLLDPITGVLFLIGLYALLRTIHQQPQRKLGLILFWLAPLLPSALSDEAPHAMRALGAVPAVCAIAAFGLDALARFANESIGLRRAVAHLLLPALLLPIAAAWNAHDFFRVWGKDPAVAQAFTADIPRFFDYCADLADDAEVYLSPYVYNSPNIRLLNLSRRAPLRKLADTEAFEPTDSEGPDRIYVTESRELNALIAQLYPEAKEIGRYSVYAAKAGRIYSIERSALRRRLTPDQQRSLRTVIGHMVESFRRQSAAW